MKVLAFAWSLGALAADAPPPAVLILHGNQQPTPAQLVIDQSLRAILSGDPKRPAPVFSEYLDDEWVSSETHGAAQAEFLRIKYGGRNIRVVVADAIPALRFVLKHGDGLLSGASVVPIAVAIDRIDAAKLPSNVVRFFEDNDPAPTLQMALRMHPGTRQIAFIRGATEFSRFWDGRFERAMQTLGAPLQSVTMAGLPTAEVLQRVAALPKDTIVFTPGYFTDGSGEISTPRQSIERIAAASSVPVYVAFDTTIGTGAVGGYVSRYEDQATQVGDIVVRLLNGAAPSEIAAGRAARTPMVDWRQLRRWDIDPDLLPAGTIVRFREPTVLERYRTEIAVALAVVLLQAALIGALLLERRSRRRTALALEDSQKRMNLVARSTRLSLWKWDTARNGSTARKRSRAGAGDSDESAVPFIEVLDATHPADRELLQRAVETSAATGDEFDIEYRKVWPDGAMSWVAARGRPEEGDPTHLYGIALDVTERKVADLRAAQDRTALRHVTRVSVMGQLSAAIAHQLNQPLAAILGNAEAAQTMLKRGNVDAVELKQICDDIVAEDNRAANVIRHLGDLYKRADTSVVALDLNILVRETLDLLRTELLIRHVTPVVELAPKLPRIDGSFVQLQQVVLNLVVNAADAVFGTDPSDRKVTVRTELCDVGVRLCVVDNGTGIAPSQLNSVFDPFWSTKEGGMGMGLAVCRSIIAAHRGTIAATNNPRRGATFCVELPAGQRA